MTSGPTTGLMMMSAVMDFTASGAHVTNTVTAPICRARSRAPRTKGVIPQAAKPTTTSFGPTRLLVDGLGAILRVILCPFDGADQGPPAAGDDALDQRGPDAECRRTFRGVEDAEPAAGAGADVEQPATFAEAIHDQINRGGNALTLRARPPAARPDPRS